MSSVPKSKWVELFHPDYPSHLLRFSIEKKQKGFICYSIVVQPHMREHSPLYVGDIDYMYVLLSKTLLYFFIHSLQSETKVVINYKVLLDGMRPEDRIVTTFAIGESVNFLDKSGELHPNFFREIKYALSHIPRKGQDSSKGEVLQVIVKVRYFNYEEKQKPLTKEEGESKLIRAINMLNGQVAADLEYMKMLSRPVLGEEEGIAPRTKRPYKYGTIQPLKKISKKEMSPYLVADIETYLDDDKVHVPYATGVMTCFPNKMNTYEDIVTWYSVDSIHLQVEERTAKMFSSFLKHVESEVRRIRKSSLVVYFHNMARFDGIFLLRHLVTNHSNYKVQPLIREGVLYEMKVSFGKRHSYVIRDSYLLLPSSLESLAHDLCPQLGGKLKIDHEKVKIENLISDKYT